LRQLLRQRHLVVFVTLNFVLTVEVAHLVFKHYNDDKTKRGRQAYLLGTHSLKGVWGGRPYPVFAISRPLEAPTPEQLLAKAFGDGDNPGLVTDEYPHRTPSEVLGQSRHTAALKGGRALCTPLMRMSRTSSSTKRSSTFGSTSTISMTRQRTR
jgi:hypothetical protein